MMSVQGRAGPLGARCSITATRMKLSSGLAGVAMAIPPISGIRGKGLMGTLLRYPYEVRDEEEYFADMPDQRIPSDMLDILAQSSKEQSLVRARTSS
jgi:hypothetical protein